MIETDFIANMCNSAFMTWKTVWRHQKSSLNTNQLNQLNGNQFRCIVSLMNKSLWRRWQPFNLLWVFDGLVWMEEFISSSFDLWQAAQRLSSSLIFFKCVSYTRILVISSASATFEGYFWVLLNVYSCHVCIRI